MEEHTDNNIGVDQSSSDNKHNEDEYQDELVFDEEKLEGD